MPSKPNFVQVQGYQGEKRWSGKGPRSSEKRAFVRNKPSPLSNLQTLRDSNLEPGKSSFASTFPTVFPDVLRLFPRPSRNILSILSKRSEAAEGRSNVKIIQFSSIAVGKGELRVS